MGLFTGNTVASGNIIYAADHNTLVSLLTTVLNGNVDSSNIATAGVITAGLADDAVTEAKVADGFLHGSDGYIDATDTWTYASSTTFTIAGVDRTTMFPVGTKLRLTQTTDKYFYVTATSFSTNTTVTVTGGSDYTLANAAITSPRYSYMECPQGFPQYFNYVPTWTNLTIGSSSVLARFEMRGQTVSVRTEVTLAAGNFPVGTLSMSLPVTSRSNYIATEPIGVACFADVGTNLYLGHVHWASTTTVNLRAMLASGTYVSDFQLTGAGPFSWANGDIITGSFTYEAA